MSAPQTDSPFAHLSTGLRGVVDGRTDRATAHHRPPARRESMSDGRDALRIGRAVPRAVPALVLPAECRRFELRL